MAIYPTGTPTNADLYVALDNFSTTLSALIDNVQTTISLTSVIGLPTIGILTIDSEKVKYTGISGNDLTGCTRGFSATSAASHANGATVMFNIVEEHHNVIKDEVIAVETDLRAVQAALNDADTPASTAADVKDRFDQVVSEIKLITGNTNWYDTVAKNLTQLLPLSGGTMTGAILYSAGTAGAPSISFSADTDTGVFLNGVGYLAFTTSGTNRFQIYDTAIQPTVPIRGSNGTVTSPAYSFDGDTDTGMYYSTNAINFAINGAQAAFFVDNGSSHYGLRLSNGVASDPALTFINDTNTGLFSTGSDRFGISLGGVKFAEWVSTSGLQVNDGSVTNPSLTFMNDPNTGIYLSGTDEISMGTNGTRALTISATQAVKIKGTSTNNDATAGDYGEYVESVIPYASRVNAGGTGIYTDITSITLSAGDWDISGIWQLSQNGATISSNDACAITNTSGNSGTGVIWGNNAIQLGIPTGAYDLGGSVAGLRKSISSSTTFYLKFRMAYSAGTPQAYGRISARRVR